MSLQVGRVKGIPIRLHFTLIVSIALISFTLASDFMPFYFPGLTSAEYWTIGIVGAVIMFASVLLHEIAHSILAQKYGVKVREIVLFVFGGVSDISEELRDYREEVKMAAAGPATSFALSAAFALAWWLVSMITGGGRVNITVPILYYAAFLNLVLGLFNLIPAFPSDGGRILRAALVRRKKDFDEATKSAANIGIAISYGFMAFGFFSLLTGEIIGGIWILLLGWFLRSGAESYLAQIRLTSILSRIYLRDIMNTNVISVAPGMRADQLLRDYFNRYMRSAFPVVDDKNRILGLVTLARIAKVPEQSLAGASAAEIMIKREDLAVMDADDTAESALKQMTQKRLGKVFVCRVGTDELVGIVSKTDVLNVEVERQEISRAAKSSSASGAS